jgi:hypothetical protein
MGLIARIGLVICYSIISFNLFIKSTSMYKHLLIAFTVFSYFSLLCLLSLLITFLSFLFSGYYNKLLTHIEVDPYLVYVFDCLVCAALESLLSLPLNFILLLVTRFYLSRNPDISLSSIKQFLFRLGAEVKSLLGSLSLADFLALIFTIVSLVVIVFIGLVFWLC